MRVLRTCGLDFGKCCYMLLSLGKGTGTKGVEGVSEMGCGKLVD